MTDETSPPVSAVAEQSGVPADVSKKYNYSIWQVISASAAGTVIEWYDFYIFGSLAAIISPLFYPPGNDVLALIAYLSTFAGGFVVPNVAVVELRFPEGAAPQLVAGAAW